MGRGWVGGRREDGPYKVRLCPPDCLPRPARLGAVPEHPESSQHLGLCPAAEGHRQPAGTVPPLPGAGALKRGWGWSSRHFRPGKPGLAWARGPQAGHSWAGLSEERTRGPGPGSAEAATPCDDCRPRRTSEWNEHPEPRSRGQRPERVGERSRCWDSVFNRELSTPGVFQTLPCGFAVQPLPALWLVFAVD